MPPRQPFRPEEWGYGPGAERHPVNGVAHSALPECWPLAFLLRRHQPRAAPHRGEREASFTVVADRRTEAEKQQKDGRPLEMTTTQCIGERASRAPFATRLAWCGTHSHSSHFRRPGVRSSPSPLSLASLPGTLTPYGRGKRLNAMSLRSLFLCNPVVGDKPFLWVSPGVFRYRPPLSPSVFDLREWAWIK